MKHPASKMNTLFLIMLISYLLVSVGMNMLVSRFPTIGVIPVVVAGELAVVLPGLIFLLLFRCNIAEWIPLRKVKGSTIGFTLLLTVLIQPLIYFLNIISQLLEKNVALDLFSRTEGVSDFALVAVIGIFGPVCEEVVFRGILLTGFKRSGRIFASILWTALLFGLFHLNLNQLGYAFLIGFVSAMLVEATDSLIPSLILHIAINSYNVLLMLALEFLYRIAGMQVSDLAGEAASVATPDMLLHTAGFLLIPATFATVLAVIVYRAILKREGTLEHLHNILPFTKKEATEEESEPKGPILSVTGVAGVALCLFMIFLLEKVVRFFLQ